MMAIPWDLWGQSGRAQAEVVGESHYGAAIRELLGNDFEPDGGEVTVVAELLPEPGNQHDRNAVAVRVGGRPVGYLPREEAARYAPVLSRLAAEGFSPQVPARVWAAERDDHSGRRRAFRGSVRLDLAEPHLIVPVNAPPAGDHRLLPPGHAIPVTGEEHHLEALLPFLRPEGECWAYATLHEAMEQTARSSRVVVEVRLDGKRAGRLSPKMSGDLMPAVRHLAAQGRDTAARAMVKGNRLKVEITLYALRAHELPHSWMAPAPPPDVTAVLQVPESVVIPPPAAPPRPAAAPESNATVPIVPRTHAPIPPPPTGIRFAVPPGWPAPPPDWIPPSGWQPDPQWPPAPGDWQWWVLTWD